MAVTEGHGVPSISLVTDHDHHTHRILSELETGEGVSQRTLSRSLGIALGLTNLLIRNLVRRGFIRIIHIRPNRVRYLLTPAGIAEKARMSRQILQNNVRFYTEARDRIREQFARLSADWPDRDGRATEKRIAFYGAGEVAEIGYICLQGTDLRLVAVVDDKRDQFFDVPVHRTDWLRGAGTDSGGLFERLVVMSFGETEKVKTRLESAGVPSERVFWV